MYVFPPVGFRAFVLGACLCAAFPARARAADGPPPPARDASAPVARLGYTIKRPDGWSVRAGTMPQIGLALTCDADPAASISVVTTPAGGEGEITERAAREMKEMYMANLPGYTVTSEEWRTVGGARAYRISARYTPASGALRMTMQNAQALFIAGDTVYTITYTSTPELFMKHLGEFETVLDGFRAQAAAVPGTPGTGAATAPASRRP